MALSNQLKNHKGDKMPTYADLLQKSKDFVKVVVIHAVDDETLKQRWVITVNYHADYGIVEEQLRHFETSSRRNLRRRLAFLKKVLGRRGLRLVGTNNSLGSTRLLYELTQKP